MFDTAKQRRNTPLRDEISTPMGIENIYSAWNNEARQALLQNSNAAFKKPCEGFA